MKDGNREGKPISKSNESRRKITEQAGYRTLKKSKLQQIEEKSNTTGIVIPKLAARNQQNREPPLLHLLGSEKELASIHQKARKKQQRSISVTPKEQVNHNQVNMQAKYTFNSIDAKHLGTFPASCALAVRHGGHAPWQPRPAQDRPGRNRAQRPALLHGALHPACVLLLGAIPSHAVGPLQ